LNNAASTSHAAGGPVPVVATALLPHILAGARAAARCCCGLQCCCGCRCCCCGWQCCRCVNDCELNGERGPGGACCTILTPTSGGELICSQARGPRCIVATTVTFQCERRHILHTVLRLRASQLEGNTCHCSIGVGCNVDAGGKLRKIYNRTILHGIHTGDIGV